MPQAAGDIPYWSRGAAELIAALRTSPDGLTAPEAAARLARFGPNTAIEDTGPSALRLLWRQFESPLVITLVFAATVSLVVQSWVDAAIILAIVILSSMLGYSQEYRASAAVAELRRRIALTARILREGREQPAPAVSVVPGDIVLLSAGNLVPADGVVIEAKDFLVTEASLTGESFPVEKQPGTVPPATSLAARTNCVFLGTSVRSGTAKALIVKTGRDTAFGAIAARLRARPSETAFARGIRQFGYLLLRIMVAMVVFVITVNLLLERPPLESLLFAVALAVGMSPELLPAIVSVTLSAGARAMARRGVIVRRLEAIESLGSVDILCADKTGTLTTGVAELSDAVAPDGTPSPDVHRLAFLNANFETGIENPLDAAVVASGSRAQIDIAGWSKIDEIPYDFLRKRLTIVVADPVAPQAHLIITKGAVDAVLSICTEMTSNACAQPLDSAAHARLRAYYSRKGAEGFRVLALATKRVPASARYGRDDEHGLTLSGFLLFRDPPKPQIQNAIRDLAALGIAIKIISGDNRFVTAHVARAVGLDPGAMMTGEEIARLRDESLWHLAERTQLFTEVDPQQKERIVRALQRSGHAVAYMGDGINDAPALHAADVGISVDDAVDVARESADIVLLGPDLEVLHAGIEEGRRTFANTLKYICITTSANFGNMISMALAALFLPFLPLLAKQILLNNFLSDLPSMTISTDNVEAEAVARAQRWNIAEVQKFMLVFGLLSTGFDLLTFLVLLHVFEANEATFRSAWFVVSVLTELAVLLVLRTHAPLHRSAPSRILLGTTLAIAALAVAFPFTGQLASAFEFVPLTPVLMSTVMLIVIGYAICTEIARRRMFRVRPTGRDHHAR